MLENGENLLWFVLPSSIQASDSESILKAFLYLAQHPKHCNSQIHIVPQYDVSLSLLHCHSVRVKVPRARMFPLLMGPKAYSVVKIVFAWMILASAVCDKPGLLGTVTR